MASPGSIAWASRGPATTAARPLVARQRFLIADAARNVSLLFQPEHVESIRAGTKTATRRDWAEAYGRPPWGRFGWR